MARAEQDDESPLVRTRRVIRAKDHPDDHRDDGGQVGDGTRD